MSDTFIGDAVGDTDDIPGPFFTKYYGIAGNDTLLTSTTGFIYMDGGMGDDTLGGAEDSFGDFYGGSGHDLIEGGSSDTEDFLYGGAGDDIIDGDGVTPGGPDYIEGGQGIDSLSGGGGDDEIYGGSGDESGPDIFAGVGSETAAPGLFGGDGDDYLDGGRGEDLLDGGLGFDTQVGGPGNDIFDFNDAADSAKGKLRDLILDFKKGDRIDLSDIQGGLDFIGKKGFHGEAGEVRLKKSILQADFDGNGKSDFEIKLDGVTKLKDADLIL
jgi:Ca2+-binding RTX toxin-like protein